MSYQGYHNQKVTPQEKLAQFQEALAHTDNYKHRAHAFLQPSTGKTVHKPPMTLSMVLIINAIVFIRALESKWPDTHNHDAVPHLDLASRFQRDTINLLVSLDFRQYVRMLNNVYDVTDEDLEVLRMFYILLDELEIAVGRRGAHPFNVFAMYYHKGIDRAIEASTTVVKLLGDTEARLTAQLLQLEAQGETQAVVHYGEDSVSGALFVALPQFKGFWVSDIAQTLRLSEFAVTRGEIPGLSTGLAHGFQGMTRIFET